MASQDAAAATFADCGKYDEYTRELDATTNTRNSNDLLVLRDVILDTKFPCISESMKSHLRSGRYERSQSEMIPQRTARPSAPPLLALGHRSTFVLSGECLPTYSRPSIAGCAGTLGDSLANQGGWVAFLKFKAQLSPRYKSAGDHLFEPCISAAEEFFRKVAVTNVEMP